MTGAGVTGTADFDREGVEASYACTARRASGTS